jgi:hypothetical protein
MKSCAPDYARDVAGDTAEFSLRDAMGVQKRRTQQSAATKADARAEAPAANAQRPSKLQNGSTAATATAAAAAPTPWTLPGWQLPLAGAALLITLSSAACEWPIYM